MFIIIFEVILWSWLILNILFNFIYNWNITLIILVNIDSINNTITVWNNGKGIPIEIHKEHNIYVPELIFGHLLTGSNYDDDQKKVTGGRNGYGAKLANIFSLMF